MSAQDKTEEVLREIHLLFSKAEPYQDSRKKVVVDKTEVTDLLKELTVCISALQDEFELTVSSRDAAARQTRKETEGVVLEAQKKADDVYAASIMYTDDALRGIEKIVESTNNEILLTVDRFKKELASAKADLRSNRTDLKAQLQEMADAQKYIRLIDDENLRLAKEEAIREDLQAAKNENLAAGVSTGTFSGADEIEPEKSPYADIKPEIKVNAAYFEAHGIPLENEAGASGGQAEQAGQSGQPADGEEPPPISTDDLDAEYFAWKAEDDAENEAEKKDVAGIVENLKDQFKNIFK